MSFVLLNFEGSQKDSEESPFTRSPGGLITESYIDLGLLMTSAGLLVTSVGLLVMLVLRTPRSVSGTPHKLTTQLTRSPRKSIFFVTDGVPYRLWQKI